MTRRVLLPAVIALAALSATVALAATVQLGGLRVTAHAQLRPYKLPRVGTTPISIFMAGHLEGIDGAAVPQLRELRFKLNRHGVLRREGLPTCEIGQLQPATSNRALAGCGAALIGSGQFWANIVLPDQARYRTRGRLLVFNGRRGSEPLILAHIFTSDPFNTSYVIPFSIRHIPRGAFGTELRAYLPATFGTWGYIDRIKLNLARRYRYRGRRLSFLNAGCAAPDGVQRIAFPLAFAEFKFRNGLTMAATVPKTCGVREA